MENVKETIAKNLTKLRKAHNMTQSALAEKLNYSDKAISRWEHAETLPDIETLCRICEMYGVSFEYLLSKDAEVVIPEKEQSNTARSLLICIISVCAVWLTTTVLFTFISTLAGNYVWQLFIWGVPLSSVAIALCNALWWKSKICLSITASIFNWTSILGLYLLFASYNIWLLFVVGAPIQAIIILAATMPKKKRISENEIT